MGLCLLFLPNYPGTTFIQGATFIPDSRVEQIIRTGSSDNYCNGISGKLQFNFEKWKK